MLKTHFADTTVLQIYRMQRLTWRREREREKSISSQRVFSVEPLVLSDELHAPVCDLEMIACNQGGSLGRLRAEDD